MLRRKPERLRILWVGTKSPWPPADGGRVLSLETIRGVAQVHDVTLVVPTETETLAVDLEKASPALRDVRRLRFVEARRSSRARSVLRAATSDLPFSIAHHARPEVESAVERLLAEETFDLVHSEQLQAFRQCRPALARGVPIVLREQNVESELWSGLAAQSTPPVSWWLRREGRRLAAWEGRAVSESAVTIALTARDGVRLAALGHGAKIVTIPVPFKSRLPLAEAKRPGTPALVVFGSANWKPNQDGSLWFLREIWPSIKRRFPEAIVHVYGLPFAPSDADGVEIHPSPESSVEAFAPGSILTVPLRFASGARMRILEGFSRGLPVIATPVAADGMEVVDGVHLLLADTPDGFIRAISRLTTEPALALDVTENGRALLKALHDPARSLSALLEVYGRVAGRGDRVDS